MPLPSKHQLRQLIALLGLVPSFRVPVPHLHTPMCSVYNLERQQLCCFL